MQFLFELLDLGLADVGVKSFLHLFFQLVLSLPEENLPFAFYDLVHELCLFLPDDINVVLQLGGFVLHFLELLDELALQVDILVLEFGLFIRVEGDVVVELVHFLLQPLEIDSYLSDFLLVAFVVVVESLFLLLQNHLLVL
jgi:hypothetical protein